jgi:cell division protein FtsB
VTNTELTPHQNAERKAEVVRMYDTGKTFSEIAVHFGISKQWVHTIYWQAVAEVPQLAVHEMRAQQNARLEKLIDRTEQVMRRIHLVTSGGKIVKDDAGKALLDDGPELQAIATQARLLEQQAKLNGTNAPAQVTVNGEIKYEIVGVDMDALR